MNWRKNMHFKIMVGSGVLLFIFIAFIIIKSTSTVIAVVPNQNLLSGTVITKDMVKTITVAANTPEGFITDKSSLIGQRLRIEADENQLLYVNNVMTSWDELIDGSDIPKNYVVTSMLIPSDRAVGGLITAGDTVDVLGVPNSYNSNSSPGELKSYLGDMGKYDSYGANGANIFWVLTNVKILQTDSTLSAFEGSSISKIVGEGDGGSKSQQGSYYIVALSYSDYQKLRLSEIYLNLFLSLAPTQNTNNPPLYDQMRQNTIKKIQDSQNQSDKYLKDVQIGNTSK